MTTPRENLDPYASEGIVDIPADEDRHPYTADDFGLTPRAISPELAFNTAPEHPLEGDPSATRDETPVETPPAVTTAGLIAAPLAAAAAAIPAARPVEEARQEEARQEEEQRDSYTGEREVVTKREEVRRRDPDERRSMLRRGDIGIYVPAGFFVISLAVLLALFLLEPSGVWLAGGVLVFLICLLLTAITTLDLIVTARRRRRAGEDVPHAIGLE